MLLEEGFKVRIFEDMDNEFKMHSRVTITEIPPRCTGLDKGRVVRTLQPVSKSISAFLNTNGGRIFLGIDDDGVLRGITMTPSQREHFYLSIHACLSSFKPPVPPDLIGVRMDPVKRKSYNVNKKLFVFDDENDDDDDFTVDSAPLTHHLLREHLIGGVRCPCDRTDEQKDLFLVTIQVGKSLDGTLYQNEEGLCYRRRNGSNRMLTLDEIRQYAETERKVIQRPSGPIRYKLREQPSVSAALLSFVSAPVQYIRGFLV